jgi:hypothetical protein
MNQEYTSCARLPSGYNDVMEARSSSMNWAGCARANVLTGVALATLSGQRQIWYQLRIRNEISHKMHS